MEQLSQSTRTRFTTPYTFSYTRDTMSRPSTGAGVEDGVRSCHATFDGLEEALWSVSLASESPGALLRDRPRQDIMCPRLLDVQVGSQ
jgi:hypothetical protein